MCLWVIYILVDKSKPFLHFLNWVNYWVVYSDMSSLWNLHIGNNFYWSMAWFFIFSMSFEVANFFLIYSKKFLFLLYSKDKSLSKPKPKDFLLFSGKFYSLGYSFWTHFIWSDVVAKVHFIPCGYPVVPAPFVAKIIFSSVNCLNSHFQESVDHTFMGLFLDYLFCFIDQCIFI